ncbi:MAG: glycosyltransferase [Candidatus Fermentibacter sp.]|nr:glycosyltransferase [Candidatus Fermentibacter sp.]
MRILHVYKDVYPPVHGGIERYIHDTVSSMAARGHESTILVASRKPALRIGRRSIDGSPVIEAPCLGRLFSNPVCPGLASLLRRLHREMRFDLVHYHHPLPTAAVSWAFAGLDAPHIVTYHSDIVRQSLLVPLIEPFLWPFLRRARAVLATSPAYAESSRFLRRLSNVHVVPLGVDTRRFSPGPADGRDGYFLFVGRFRRYKGIPVLLEAWRGLPGRRLVMAGSGPLSKEISEAASRDGSLVELAGDVSDDRLVELYRGARALILPSTERSEAFGLVQVEAMACGTPVISTDIATGVPWVNRDGESGLTVRAGDPGAIREAVEKLDDDALRDDLSAGARSRALTHFDMERTMDELERICRDAAGI